MSKVNTQVAVGFPKENVSPAEKAEKKWGLQCAQALRYNYEAYGPALFHNKADVYQELIAFAFGQQPEDLSKPSLGINPQNQEQSFIGGI